MSIKTAGRPHAEKKVKTVEVGNRNYFLNDVPAELKNKPEWFLASKKVNVFFPKHIDEFTYPAAEMRSWFDDKKQPSEAQVRRACIWSFDSYGDYSIKSAGGSVSDNIWVSHLVITIADPKTGLDKNVVILKKYSTNFADVLITIAEVQALENATESRARREANRRQLLPSLMREIIRWEKGITSIGNGKGDWTKANIDQMKKQCREDYSLEEISDCLARLADYAKTFENRSLLGGTGAEFLAYVAREIYKLPETDMHFQMAKPAVQNLRPQIAQQLCLFT